MVFTNVLSTAFKFYAIEAINAKFAGHFLVSMNFVECATNQIWGCIVPTHVRLKTLVYPLRVNVRMPKFIPLTPFRFWVIATPPPETHFYRLQYIFFSMLRKKTKFLQRKQYTFVIFSLFIYSTVNTTISNFRMRFFRIWTQLQPKHPKNLTVCHRLGTDSNTRNKNFANSNFSMKYLIFSNPNLNCSLDFNSALTSTPMPYIVSSSMHQPFKILNSDKKCLATPTSWQRSLLTLTLPLAIIRT